MNYRNQNLSNAGDFWGALPRPRNRQHVLRARCHAPEVTCMFTREVSGRFVDLAWVRQGSKHKTEALSARHVQALAPHWATHGVACTAGLPSIRGMSRRETITSFTKDAHVILSGPRSPPAPPPLPPQPVSPPLPPQPAFPPRPRMRDYDGTWHSTRGGR